MEGGEDPANKEGTNDVVLLVSNSGEASSYKYTQLSSSPKNPENLGSRVQVSNDVIELEEKTALKPNSRSLNIRSLNMGSPSNRVSTPQENRRQGGEEDYDDEDEFEDADGEVEEQKSGKKMRVWVIIEVIALVCIMGCLIASLTVHNLKTFVIWDLELWKWCVVIMVIFCGRLATEWIMNVVVFLMERNFQSRQEVLYFVSELKHSIQLLLWSGSVLVVWVVLADLGAERSKETTPRILSYITRALASFLIGAALWLVKTILVKKLAFSFHEAAFFDKIQESMFRQYILQVVTGRSMYRNRSTLQLRKTKRKKVSAGAMKLFMDDEIISENEAKAAANRIFKTLAKPGHKYITEEDLLSYFKLEEEVEKWFLQIPGAMERRMMTKSQLKNWVVSTYLKRTSLVNAINYSKITNEELNKIASAIWIIAFIVVFLLVMKFLTTEIIVLISSQFLLLTFMFGNTAKTIFESIVFVFIVQPFHIGDRCVIDGVEMVVKEISLMTTIFLKNDKEKIFYPNSALVTKPVSNFTLTPEMSDSVEFAIDASTSNGEIRAIQEKLGRYLLSKPRNWKRDLKMVVKGIEDEKKLKIGLSLTHTMFDNNEDKSDRRSELILELKKILEEQGIKCHSICF